ncbi:DEAD/DEAH box helicase family protein [Muricauda sp. HICW]|uniref:DEAD/DEAH box helicase family protein n=1 Tax=Flagellimonas chongwuensis TaxID=2697365 RepID=A0A850NC28_9FLAO|nr:DEAD/DEAH box helicase [Allomuricauda chongwuensis]NVN18263.1 DEAD/DEAH box helicase family protein [Allomuricauda chongwuensis]
MKISVQENKIIIDSSNYNFKKYQISQLGFFGYKSIEECFFSNSLNVKSDILKILGYLDNENISYEIDESVKLILEQISLNEAEKKRNSAIALNIKSGILNEDSFTSFKDFLDELPRKLKPHQVKSAFHLYSLKNGANFSVPGSGKTSVVISVYEKLRLEGQCNVMFVVGPPPCFQPWQNEFKETLGRLVKTTILSGGNKNLRKEEYYKSSDSIDELYLSTFQTLMNDHEEVIKLIGQKEVNCYFVVDEAHYMKQINGSWASSLLQISKYAKFRCVLTGTPIPKSYSDVFNLFDFLWVNNSPLTESDKIAVLLAEKNGKNEEVKEILDKKIGPLFYRVRKKDLGLKPPIFHKPLLIPMNPLEKRIYNLIKSKIHELSKDDFINNEQILSKLWKGRMIRMRQATSYPKLLLKSLEDYSEDLLDENVNIANIIRAYDDLETPGKLEYLTEKVKNLNNQNKKVLIWSNFIGTLELLKSHFIKENLHSELIYGKTPVKKNGIFEVLEEKTREEIRDEFVDPESGLDILIANPAACAESISLHKTCFHAFYYDLSYNCAQYLQSLDRIHRVGGSEFNTANYYFLQYENSIDQDIKENLEYKAQKMYNIVEQDYAIYNLDMFEENNEDDLAAYKRIFKN